MNRIGGIISCFFFASWPLIIIILALNILIELNSNFIFLYFNKIIIILNKNVMIRKGYSVFNIIYDHFIG